MRGIDLNSDLGEGCGNDDAMLDIVTSANVACGGHAGDPETMFHVLSRARERNVVVGAHPGFPDREGFGRRRLAVSGGEIERFIAAQIGTLMGVAALAGVGVVYVKPHGMLANIAADERPIADAIIRAIAAVDRRLAVLAISGTELEHAASAHGLDVYSEIFADRGYTPKGRLVPRTQPGALIEGADEAAERLVQFMRSGQMPTLGGPPVALAAQSICIHGDNAHAVAVAERVRGALKAQGVAIEPFLHP